MLGAYNGGTLFRNVPGATAREIKISEMDANGKDGIDKAHTLARGEHLPTAFLLSLDRRRYGELTLALNNDYAKHQRNYPNTLTNIYGLMVAFDPTRVVAVTEGHKKGINFRNVATDSEARVTGDVGSRGDGAGIKR